MRNRKKRRVGLKYCGGCRAQYDRGVVVNRMKEALKDRIEFVSPDGEEAECILAVCGCKTACAEITGSFKRRVRFIAGEEDAAAWIKKEMQSKE